MDILRKGWQKSKTSLFYAAIFMIFVAPIIRLLVMSLKGPDGYSLQNYYILLQDARTLEAIVNTVIIALGSTVIAAVVGVLMALAVAYTNLRHKRLMEMMVLMPFIIPSYIITLSWSGLLTKRGLVNQFLESHGLAAIDMYTTGGILLVIGICNIPIVYLSVVHMLRKIPLDMEWASRACGFTIWQTLWKIDLKEALPAIMSGSLLAFLSAIDNFSVPAFLGISSGIPVLSTYIYEKAISFGPDSFPLAASLSVILSVIAITGTLIEALVIRKGGAMERIKDDYAVRIYLQKGRRRLLEWGLFLLWGLINLVPLAAMISSAFLKNYGLAMTRANLSLQHFSFVFTNTGVLSAIRNSILLAVITCVICILVGTAMAYLKVRRNSRAVALAEKCASLTYAIPGIVLALAMIFHWTEPLPGVKPGIYGTINILIIAYITRYLILQIKGSTTALLSVNPELEEAVRVSGRSKWTLWRTVMIPLLTRPVLSSAFLIFVSALTELTLSSMLASAGTKTIGLTIFNFQQAGDYSLSAAMSTVIVILILAGYSLVHFKASERKEKKEHEFVSGTRKSAVRTDAGPS